MEKKKYSNRKNINWNIVGIATGVLFLMTSVPLIIGKKGTEKISAIILAALFLWLVIHNVKRILEKLGKYHTFIQIFQSKERDFYSFKEKLKPYQITVDSAENNQLLSSNAPPITYSPPYKQLQPKNKLPHPLDPVEKQLYSIEEETVPEDQIDFESQITSVGGEPIYEILEKAKDYKRDEDDEKTLELAEKAMIAMALAARDGEGEVLDQYVIEVGIILRRVGRLEEEIRTIEEYIELELPPPRMDKRTELLKRLARAKILLATEKGEKSDGYKEDTMARLEVHAGTVGKDAELFAEEIVQSISKATGLKAEVKGKVSSFYSI